MADSYTKLLLHFEGFDGSYDFIDSSPFVHLGTSVNDAQIDHAQKVFNESSGLFDGTGDCVTFPDHADWDRGAGHYTIDCRVRLNANGKIQWIVGKNSAPTWYQLSFYIDVSNYLNCRISKTAGPTIFTTTASNQALSTDIWYHVAMVINRTTNKVMLFVDGTECTYSTQPTIDGTAYTNSVALIIGSQFADGTSRPFDGWIDELRLSKGVARWTSNFTPPTLPYDTEIATPSVFALELISQIPIAFENKIVQVDTLALELNLRVPEIESNTLVEISISTFVLELDLKIPAYIGIPIENINIQSNVLSLELELQTPIIYPTNISINVLTLTAKLKLRVPTVGAFFPVISTSPDLETFIDVYSNVNRIVDYTESGRPVIIGINTFDEKHFDFSLFEVSDNDRILIMNFYEVNKENEIFWINEQDGQTYAVIFTHKPDCEVMADKNRHKIEIGFKQVAA